MERMTNLSTYRKINYNEDFFLEKEPVTFRGRNIYDFIFDRKDVINDLKNDNTAGTMKAVNLLVNLYLLFYNPDEKYYETKGSREYSYMVDYTYNPNPWNRSHVDKYAFNDIVGRIFYKKNFDFDVEKNRKKNHLYTTPYDFFIENNISYNLPLDEKIAKLKEAFTRLIAQKYFVLKRNRIRMIIENKILSSSTYGTKYNTMISTVTFPDVSYTKFIRINSAYNNTPNAYYRNLRWTMVYYDYMNRFNKSGVYGLGNLEAYKKKNILSKDEVKDFFDGIVRVIPNRIPIMYDVKWAKEIGEKIGAHNKTEILNMTGIRFNLVGNEYRRRTSVKNNNLLYSGNYESTDSLRYYIRDLSLYTAKRIFKEYYAPEANFAVDAFDRTSSYGSSFDTIMKRDYYGMRGWDKTPTRNSDTLYVYRARDNGSNNPFLYYYLNGIYADYKFTSYIANEIFINRFARNTGNISNAKLLTEYAGRFEKNVSFFGYLDNAFYKHNTYWTSMGAEKSSVVERWIVRDSIVNGQWQFHRQNAVCIPTYNQAYGGTTPFNGNFVIGSEDEVEGVDIFAKVIELYKRNRQYQISKDGEIEFFHNWKDVERFYENHDTNQTTIQKINYDLYYEDEKGRRMMLEETISENRGHSVMKYNLVGKTKEKDKFIFNVNNKEEMPFVLYDTSITGEGGIDYVFVRE